MKSRPGHGLPATVLNRRADEELANALTHGLGLALSVVGLLGLMQGSTAGAGSVADRGMVLACTIYGLTLVALYAASTAYHSFPQQWVKEHLRTLDQVCIYLLIAGTYTPFVLSYLRGTWGWTIIVLIWAMALAGVVFRVAFAKNYPHITSIPYVLMGWLAVVAAKPILESFPSGLLAWIVLGGIFYTAGIAFYVNDRRYSHAIWHLFVLGGSVCHYLGIWFYVVPLAT